MESEFIKPQLSELEHLSKDVKEKTETKQDSATETEKDSEPVSKISKTKINYFQCSICILKERFDYFGQDPPFLKNYKLLEDSYIIEDPFMAPKQGQVIILGAHCIKCLKCVCRDTNCSIYFDGTYCINCAKLNFSNFPKAVQEKLNRIVV